MKSYIQHILLTISIGFTSLLYGADMTIKAYVNRNVVSMNQQFTLSVELSGKDVKSAPNPTLPQMDFAHFAGSGSSQNIQFINGKMSVSKTINYKYIASKAGTFTIGTIKVSHKGQTVQTQPIQITIKKSGSQSGSSQKSQAGSNTQSQTKDANSKELYLKAEVSKIRVYPNEPLLVSYKLYTRVGVSNLSLAKAPTMSGFWAEEIDLGRSLPQSTEIINGIQYTVAEVKKTILFPTSAGERIIEPMELVCNVQVRRQRSRSRDPFDNFFNDPFFFGRTEQKRVKSRSVKINVIPFPTENKPLDFSGLSGRFAMQGRVNRTKLKTNEAVTYTIIIQGEGNITGIPQPKPQFSSDFEVYKPKINQSIDRTGNKITGKKVFEYVLVPRMPGRQMIKPFEMAYFDIKARTYKILKTAPITIFVEKGEDVIASIPSGLSKEEVKYFGQDIRFIKTEIPRFYITGYPVYRNPFLWILFIVPVIGLLWALVYRKHLNLLESDVGYARDRRATHAAKKGLAKARALLKEGQADQFYAESAKALRQFLADKLNVSEAGMMSDEVRKQLLQKGVQQEAIDDYFNTLDAADMKRFSPSGADIEEMKKYMRRVEMVLSTMDRIIG